MTSPGVTSLPENDPIQGHDAGAHPHEVHALARRAPPDDVGDLRDFTANDGDAGQLRASIEAFGDLLQHGGRGAFDGDVVEKGNRLGADADGIVHVHRHTIDSDGVVALKHLRDQHLAADPVRTQRQAQTVPDIHDAGKEADIDHSSPRLPFAPECRRLVHPTEQRRQPELGVVEHSRGVVAQEAVTAIAGHGFLARQRTEQRLDAEGLSHPSRRARRRPGRRSSEIPPTCCRARDLGYSL